MKEFFRRLPSDELQCIWNQYDGSSKRRQQLQDCSLNRCDVKGAWHKLHCALLLFEQAECCNDANVAASDNMFDCVQAIIKPPQVQTAKAEDDTTTSPHCDIMRRTSKMQPPVWVADCSHVYCTKKKREKNPKHPCPTFAHRSHFGNKHVIQMYRVGLTGRGHADEGLYF